MPKQRIPTPAVKRAPIYQTGDVVFWSVARTSGEGVYIGHLKGDPAVLVLATAGEAGIEFDAADCSPTGRSDRHAGRQYRERYFRRFPGKLQGAA